MELSEVVGCKGRGRRKPREECNELRQLAVDDERHLASDLRCVRFEARPLRHRVAGQQEGRKGEDGDWR